MRRLISKLCCGGDCFGCPFKAGNANEQSTSVNSSKSPSKGWSFSQLMNKKTDPSNRQDTLRRSQQS